MFVVVLEQALQKIHFFPSAFFLYSLIILFGKFFVPRFWEFIYSQKKEKIFSLHFDLVFEVHNSILYKMEFP